MRSTRALSPVIAAALLTFSSVGSVRAQSLPPEVTPQQVLRWVEELSNWGRWGPDDELGTLNLITAEKRRQAAALVEEGIAVSLARDVDKETAPDNPQPLGHTVQWSEGRVGWGGDSYTISYHGYSYSHLDALPHTGVEGNQAEVPGTFSSFPHT